MKFRVNGKIVKLNGTVSVLDLLAMEKVRVPEKVYITINDRMLLQDQYELTYVKENDQVELKDPIWGM